MNICVLIPVLNEAKAIGGIVQELKKKGFAVLVVDDGSTDGSGDIARSSGAQVITHKERQGKGSSLRDGLNHIREQDFDGVITMDGDGQHGLTDLDGFIKKFSEQRSGIIVGNRMATPTGMPFIRLATNWFMSFLISAICRQSIPDTQCGFRLVGSDVLKAIQLTSRDFEIETEILIKASKKNFPISSVPIESIYRGQISHINPLLDTIRFFKYLIKESWNSRS